MPKLRTALLNSTLLLLYGCADMHNLGTIVSNSLSPGANSDRLEDQKRPQQGYNRVRKAATAMLEGIRFYDNGDYKDAIVKFSAPEIEAAPTVFRVEALKYTAFSYCVVENYARCRQAFDQALSIDADFELLASESGHPMWGPVFKEAKVASEQGRMHMPTGRERARWRGIDPWRPR